MIRSTQLALLKSLSQQNHKEYVNKCFVNGDINFSKPRESCKDFVSVQHYFSDRNRIVVQNSSMDQSGSVDEHSICSTAQVSLEDLSYFKKMQKILHIMKQLRSPFPL